MTHSSTSFFPNLPPNSLLIILIFSTWSIERQEDTLEFWRIAVHKRDCPVFILPHCKHWIKSNLFAYSFRIRGLLLEAKWTWGITWERSYYKVPPVHPTVAGLSLFFQQSMNHTHTGPSTISTSSTKPVLEAVILGLCLLPTGRKCVSHQMFPVCITPKITRIFISSAHNTAQRAWRGRNWLADDFCFNIIVVYVVPRCETGWEALSYVSASLGLTQDLAGGTQAYVC